VKAACDELTPAFELLPDQMREAGASVDTLHMRVNELEPKCAMVPVFFVQPKGTLLSVLADVHYVLCNLAQIQEEKLQAEKAAALKAQLRERQEKQALERRRGSVDVLTALILETRRCQIHPDEDGEDSDTSHDDDEEWALSRTASASLA
jgi:hypothetical protein